MLSRRLVVFVAVLVVASILFWFVAGPLRAWFSVSPQAYFTAALILAAGLAVVTPKGTVGGRKAADFDRLDSYVDSSEFLCDSCKYNNDRDCSRRERPNAVRCDDYRSR